MGVQNGSPANIYYIVSRVEGIELKILYESGSFELACFVKSIQKPLETTTKPIEVRVSTSMGVAFPCELYEFMKLWNSRQVGGQ